MASVEDIVASQNFDAIKRKRSSTQSMITIVSKSLNKLLKTENGNFDHSAIDRSRVLSEHGKLVKFHENFDVIHQAFIEFREIGENDSAESLLVEQDEQHYNEVVDKIYGSLKLFEQYEKSFGLSNPAEPNSVNSESKIMTDTEPVTGTANKDQIRAAVIKAELLFNESMGLLRTAKAKAAELVAFAKDMSTEQLASQVKESFCVRSMPCSDTKATLLDRLKQVILNADMWRIAVEAESGVLKAKDIVVFDKVKEDAEVQDIICVLDLIISAKAELIRGGVISHSSHVSAATTVTPIKVKLNTPTFSGKSRDFAIYKKEFMDVVVPGRSAAEIGALLREGLNLKEKNLLRNNDMSNYVEALDILQNEYGKPELDINDVNAELDKLRPPTGEKADQGFISFVEKVENICRDMETVSRSADLKNGHMINVLVKKLPAKVAQEWAKHKQREKIGSKTSEEIFSSLIDFLKAEKEVTKDLLCKQDSSSEKSRTHTCYVTGQTFVINNQSNISKQTKVSDKKFTKLDPLCIACKGSRNPQDSKHWTTNCDKWKALKLPDRKKMVKCQRHIQAGDSHDSSKCQGDSMSKWYNNGYYSKECGICKSTQHCAELCEQNRAITKLHNVSLSATSSSMLPVLLQANFVKSRGGSELGALWDLCSTDDYITFKKAEELNLEGRSVVLTIEGVGGVETTLDTKIYDVPLCLKKKRGRGKFAILQCYGLDQIACSAALPSKDSYESLCKKFGIRTEDVRRPGEIDLLISMRRNKFHPRAVSSQGDITLYDGPFGKVFGGTESGLDFEPYVLNGLVQARQQGCMYSSTLRAVVKSVTAVSSASIEKKLLDFFEDDSVGVSQNPKCGRCQCGQCVVGDGSMSMRMEKL